MTDFSQLHRDVVFGRAGGRIIWQPRIECWYTDKIFSGEPFPEPFRGMPVHDIYRALGCSARLYEFNACFKRVEHPSVRYTSRQLNETDTEQTIETPVGRQVAVLRRSPNSWHVSHVKWEVESEEELKVAAWREENTEWRWNQERHDTLVRELGDLGAPTIFMPRMNVQSLFIEKMGITRGIFALFDWPDTVEAYFAALRSSHDRLIACINPSPIDIINFGENVHAQTLSPNLFLQYHLPECQHRCELLHTAGKFVYSHWDGDCGPLLPYARETGLDGIEAITPAPQGDVTIEEIKEALGNNMFLIDGIPAVYFDDTYSLETLTRCTEKIIDLFAPRLILGISDEISSTGSLERVRAVGDIVNAYNTRVAKH